jgi:hypothetical protein
MHPSLATYTECMHATMCMMTDADQKMVVQVMTGTQLEQSKDQSCRCVCEEALNKGCSFCLLCTKMHNCMDLIS